MGQVIFWQDFFGKNFKLPQWTEMTKKVNSGQCWFLSSQIMNIINNFFQQMLGSPTIWDHREKASLINFETGRGIKVLQEMTFFIECFFKSDVTKYIIKVNLCIIL